MSKSVEFRRMDVMVRMFRRLHPRSQRVARPQARRRHAPRMTTDAPPVTLAEFLLARLAEDEATALAGAELPARAIRSSARSGVGVTPIGAMNAEQDAALARHDPARVLADVAAKRAVIELHGAPRAQPELRPDAWGDAGGRDGAADAPARSVPSLSPTRGSRVARGVGDALNARNPPPPMKGDGGGVRCGTAQARWSPPLSSAGSLRLTFAAARTLASAATLVTRDTSASAAQPLSTR